MSGQIARWPKTARNRGPSAVSASSRGGSRFRSARGRAFQLRARGHAFAPAMVRITFSRVISRSAISPIFRRSRSTAILSLTATSSSSSDDATSNARPCAQRLADQRHHIRVRADVDAARGLVENEDARIGDERARKHDLLLVAARQLADRLVRVGRRDPQRLDHLLRQLLLLVVREPPAAIRVWSEGRGRCSRAR